MSWMVSSSLEFPPGSWTLPKMRDCFGLPRMRLIASAISEPLHAFFTSRQGASNVGSLPSVTSANPSAARLNGPCRSRHCSQACVTKAGREAGGTDLLIALCRDGEPPWPSFGFASQQQVVEAPAKGRDLRLELRPDTSDAGHLLAGKRLHQQPRGYQVFELETGTACRPQGSQEYACPRRRTTRSASMSS